MYSIVHYLELELVYFYVGLGTSRALTQNMRTY